jgi:hypothetical protein
MDVRNCDYDRVQLIERIIIVFIHLGVLESVFGDESLLEQATEIGIPFDITCTTDDVFKRTRTSVIVGNGARNGIIGVLEKFVS